MTNAVFYVVSVKVLQPVMGVIDGVRGVVRGDHPGQVAVLEWNCKFDASFLHYASPGVDKLARGIRIVSADRFLSALI